MLPSLFLAFSALADDARQDLGVLYDLARDFAYEQAEQLQAERVEVKVSPLDRRLNLALCTEGLEPFKPSGSRFPGRASVGIRCLGPSHWSVYVSVNMALYREVVVAADFLARGDIVSSDDLETRTIDVGRLRAGYFTDPEEAQGLLLTRAVKPGKALTPSMLRKRKLVKRGDRVTLIAQAGGLSVSSQGKAKQSGARGDRIVVTNLNSKKEVEGVVIKAGAVRVDL
ncbi:MAG: flagellar basal body P-ring formation chaperone FlgA [Gammaproteobacteria bacterium]